MQIIINRLSHTLCASWVQLMLGKGELRLQRKVGILFSSKWIDKFIDLGGVNEKLVCLKVLLG